MLKAAKAIDVFYPNIIHIICVAHGIHRVCETIREYFSNVYKFISNAKKKRSLNLPQGLTFLKK